MLSLVVDEEDVQQIKPLPNLDYKIVTGSSLMLYRKDLGNSRIGHFTAFWKGTMEKGHPFLSAP